MGEPPDTIVIKLQTVLFIPPATVQINALVIHRVKCLLANYSPTRDPVVSVGRKTNSCLITVHIETCRLVTCAVLPVHGSMCSDGSHN